MDVLVGENGVTTAERVQKREDFRVAGRRRQRASRDPAHGAAPARDRRALLRGDRDRDGHDDPGGQVAARPRADVARRGDALAPAHLRRGPARARRGRRGPAQGLGPGPPPRQALRPVPDFRGELRSNTKALAALAPIGPAGRSCTSPDRQVRPGRRLGDGRGRLGCRQREHRRRHRGRRRGGGARGRRRSGAGGVGCRRRPVPRRAAVPAAAGLRSAAPPPAGSPARSAPRPRRPRRPPRCSRPARSRSGTCPPSRYRTRRAPRRGLAAARARARRPRPHRHRAAATVTTTEAKVVEKPSQTRGRARDDRRLAAGTAGDPDDRPATESDPAPARRDPPQLDARPRPGNRGHRLAEVGGATDTTASSAGDRERHPGQRGRIPASRRRRRPRYRAAAGDRRRLRQPRRPQPRLPARARTRAGGSSTRRAGPASPTLHRARRSTRPPSREPNGAAGSRGAGARSRRPSSRQLKRRRPRPHPLVDRGEPDVALGERLLAAPSAESRGRRRRSSSSSPSPAPAQDDRDRLGLEWRAALVSSSRAIASSSSSATSSASRVDLDLDLEAALAGRLAGDGAERLSKPPCSRVTGCKRHHRLAQARDRPLDDLVGALHLDAPGRRLHQLLVGGEQGLERVVVDQLGDPPPAPGPRRRAPGRRAGGRCRAPRAAPRPRPAARRQRPRLIAHSSMPRRIASATAAARSETPSFS